MKKFLLVLTFVIGMLPLNPLYAQDKQISSGLPPGQYDESKVPAYTLPDPLILMNGEKVIDTAVWNAKRRPEILRLFEENVYGKAPTGRPEGLHWKVISEDSQALGGLAVKRKVTICLSSTENWPKLDVDITLPKNDKPVPVLLVSTWTPDEQLVIGKGFGLVTFDAREIEPDDKDSAYAKGIRKYFDRGGTEQPEPEEWGTISAWSWSMRRVMDFVETDRAIDAKKVCLLGFSRFGKAALWAGAQDQRFAIVFSCESGCGGAAIARREFGETVNLINNQFPHWFAGSFKKFNDRVDDLPLDWHMLIALIAPRPVYVSTAQEDLWGDPRGSFLAAKAAEPVYQLFGEEGLETSEMPGVDTPVGNFIGYHMRQGKHGLNDYDTERFIQFAKRHFTPRESKPDR